MPLEFRGAFFVLLLTSQFNLLQLSIDSFWLPAKNLTALDSFQILSILFFYLPVRNG